jgi:hypothetical protein
MSNSGVAKVDAVMVEKAMTTRNLEVVSCGQAIGKVKFNLISNRWWSAVVNEAVEQND